MYLPLLAEQTMVNQCPKVCRRFEHRANCYQRTMVLKSNEFFQLTVVMHSDITISSNALQNQIINLYAEIYNNLHPLINVRLMTTCMHISMTSAPHTSTG